MIKRIIAISCCTLVTILFTNIPVSADVGGSFQIGNAPTIDSITGPTSMSPTAEQTVTINTTSSGTVSAMTFKTWYDSDGGAPTLLEYSNVAADTQICAIITWNGSSFSISPSGGSTTWSLGTCQNNNGDFTLKFTPGKVATETTGSAKWQMGVNVTDEFGNTGPEFNASPPDMNLRTEISTVTGSVSWDTVPKGLAFGDGTASQQALGITINIISNGNYDLRAACSTPWAGSGANANLDATGNCSVAQQFAIKIDNGTAQSSAILVGSSAIEIETGTITGESGTDYSQINLWLKLASSFTVTSYSGTITFTATNDT